MTWKKNIVKVSCLANFQGMINDVNFQHLDVAFVLESGKSTASSV